MELRGKTHCIAHYGSPTHHLNCASVRKIAKALENCAIISITDRHGYIVRVNQEFCRISQYSEAELIGNTHRIINSGYHPKSFWIAMWKQISAGKRWRGEIKNKAKDGSFYWVDTVIEPLLDDNEQIVGYLSLRHVITDKKAIQQQNEELAIIAEQTNNIVIVTDGSGKIEWVNQAFVEKSGYSLAEAIGKKPGSLLQGKETNPLHVEAIRKGLQSKQPFTQEILNYHKNGTPYWLLVHIKPILNEQQEVEKFIAIQSDITAQKQTQAKIERGLKLLKEGCEVACMGIWEFNLETEELYWSDETKKILEVPTYHQPIFQDIFRFCKTQKNQQNIIEAFGWAVSKGKPFDLALEIITAQKNTKWINIKAFVDFQAGICKRVYGTIQDITQQKLFESEMRTKNDMMLNHINDMQNSLQIIFSQRQVLDKKSKELEQKNNQILASINYAKRIQQAILPTETYIQKIVPNFFVFFKPRDIVSGDFYFVEEKYNQLIIAAVDCTGHGVPGALMTMLAFETLHEVINIQQNAGKILDELHHRICKKFSQSESGNKDGLDISLLVIDRNKQLAEFSGGHQGLFYIQNQEAHFIKGERISIGHLTDKHKKFTTHLLDISQSTYFYLFSDGFQDQFGGENNKKYSLKNLQALLYKNHTLPFEQQKNKVATALDNWMQEGNEKQIDDILVMGFQV